MSPTTESRSRQSLDNLQEIIDASGSANDTTLEQYLTPPELVAELRAKLPVRNPATIFDPQAGTGALLTQAGFGTGIARFGIELDNTKTPGGINLITGNCIKVFEAVEELMPDLRFVVANANPPFGKRWKLADGQLVDSTLATWNFVTRHAKCGFFIANANTIEKLGLQQSTDDVEVYFYERRQARQYWKGLRPDLEIGVLCWKVSVPVAVRKDWEFLPFTPPSVAVSFWSRLKDILDEEKLLRPKFNIYLNHAGFLKTYLSQRNTFKLKLTPAQVQRMHRINDCHPLTLTTEKETRDLMRDLVECGLYSIAADAKEAVQRALDEVRGVACPIMPVSEFETVAYTEEEDSLLCHTSISGPVGDPVAVRKDLDLTAGKSYPLTTGTYKFTENYKRNKVHFNETTKHTYSAVHDCVLSGNDRYIEITDNDGCKIRFMDRPNKEAKNELPEARLWEFFTKPVVETVTEVCKEAVNTNTAILKAIEMLAGYEYYDGQATYLSRMAVKDCCLVAGETGTGKSLQAISLLAMKSPQRALIIAPQGTMRASKVDDEEDEEGVAESMSASQWLKELNKFAPYLQVWEIFSYEDYQRILSLNNGELPMGVFVTYYEAFFSNGAKESCPSSWDDLKLNEYAKVHGLAQLELQKDSMGATNRWHWCESVGKEVEGVRCILEPCLSTLIGHHFDCLIVDEAHKCGKLSANITQMLIRLQPKYRFALTATPIFNVVSDIFPLMGWLAVPQWYKGDRRNAAWPYARGDLGRFNSTFLTQERDLTEEDWNRAKNPKWKGQCVKNSPIISSPARLLKLLKPNMAFISKEQCRADYIKPKIIDVRVPMGREQAVLYGYFTNRAHIPASNPFIRAGKQVAYLRNICADPAGFTHGGPKVRSNLNPKVIAILELTRDILARGEQVVIINSRIGLTNTIESKLTEIGVPLARIDSTMSAEQHAYQANLFKSGRARVMFMGIKSAAAYSFDECQNLIIGSLEYTWGNFAQAVGRVDRVTNKVIKHIYVILHQNSIEEIQYDAVAVKGDAAALCLRGKRIPRDFKPVDGNEILAAALQRFDLSGTTPESECEANWPTLRKQWLAGYHKN